MVFTGEGDIADELGTNCQRAIATAHPYNGKVNSQANWQQSEWMTTYTIKQTFAQNKAWKLNSGLIRRMWTRANCLS